MTKIWAWAQERANKPITLGLGGPKVVVWAHMKEGLCGMRRERWSPPGLEEMSILAIGLSDGGSICRPYQFLKEAQPLVLPPFHQRWLYSGQGPHRQGRLRKSWWMTTKKNKRQSLIWWRNRRQTWRNCRQTWRNRGHPPHSLTDNAECRNWRYKEFGTDFCYKNIPQAVQIDRLASLSTQIVPTMIEEGWERFKRR